MSDLENVLERFRNETRPNYTQYQLVLQEIDARQCGKDELANALAELRHKMEQAFDTLETLDGLHPSLSAGNKA